jgi:hypothetical protein
VTPRWHSFARFAGRSLKNDVKGTAAMVVLNLTVNAVYLRHSPQIYGAVVHERKIYVDPLPPKFEEAPEPLHELALFGMIVLAFGCLRAPAQAVQANAPRKLPHSRSSGARWHITMPVPDRNLQPILWYGSIPSSYGFVVALLPILP